MFKCEYCNHFFKGRNRYVQHMKRCIKFVNSTEESDNSKIISEVTDMALDSEDSKNSENNDDSNDSENSENSENSEDSEDSEDSEELQEEMASSSEMREDLQYYGDVSLISHSERYENLPASLQSFEEEPKIKNIKEFPSETW